jgi:hypothetical protein
MCKRNLTNYKYSYLYRDSLQVAINQTPFSKDKYQIFIKSAPYVTLQFHGKNPARMSCSSYDSNQFSRISREITESSNAVLTKKNGQKTCFANAQTTSLC